MLDTRINRRRRGSGHARESCKGRSSRQSGHPHAELLWCVPPMSSVRQGWHLSPLPGSKAWLDTQHMVETQSLCVRHSKIAIMKVMKVTTYHVPRAMETYT